MALPKGTETDDYVGPGSGDDLLGRDSDDAPESEDPGDPSHTRPGGDYPESGEDEDLDAEEHGEGSGDLSLIEQRAKQAEERAKQAERLREKKEAQLDEVTARLLAIEEKRVAQEQAPAPTVPSTPPYTDAALQKILSEGSADDYHTANQANEKWHREKLREEVLQQVRQESQVRSLDQVMAERLQVPKGQEGIVRERAQFWMHQGVTEAQAVLLAKGELGVDSLKPRERKSVAEESEERQARGEPQVRRGRTSGVPRNDGDLGNPDNVPAHIRSGLTRAGLDRKYLVPKKNRRDERVRREGLRRLMSRYSDLNEDKR